VTVRLHEFEPPQGDGHVEPLRHVVAGLLGRRRPTATGPFLLAIDGRSSSGKSTLAARIAEVTLHAEIVHTDDIAWWHSRFGWDDLLIDNVIDPLRRGESVVYRPRAWDERRRGGCIAVKGDAVLVVIEGVGAGRSSIAERVDSVIWVQSDLDVTDGRNEQRIDAGEIDLAGYEGWMLEEIPFQAEQRTWERADLVVCGTSEVPHNPDVQVLVLRP